jgi:hypothetical protein
MLMTTSVLLSVSLPVGAAEPASQPATRAARERTFTNKKHKVRFKVPGTMEYLKADVPGVIALYRTKPPREGEQPPLEQVQMMVVETNDTTEAIVQAMRKKIETTGGKISGTAPTTLGGTAAQEIDWVGVMAGNDTESKQVVCVREGKAFVMTFVAAPGRLGDFMKHAHVARESFEWLE